jgi:hypothetical protein
MGSFHVESAEEKAAWNDGSLDRMSVGGNRPLTIHLSKGLEHDDGHVIILANVAAKSAGY